MKIIWQGKHFKGSMQVFCNNCRAELEIQARDLKMFPGDRYFDPTTYAYVCPCCHITNYLLYGELSDSIKFDLNYRS